jgi:hypothetical protein
VDRNSQQLRAMRNKSVADGHAKVGVQQRGRMNRGALRSVRSILGGTMITRTARAVPVPGLL